MIVVSSSSYHAISADLSGPLLLIFSIVHHSRLVFKATSCIDTELLYVGSSWSSCLCLSMWRGPPEYVTYDFVPTSPAVSRMSGSSNLCNIIAEGFRFMPLGLVRLRAFRLSIWVGWCNLDAGGNAWARTERTCHSEMSQSSETKRGDRVRVTSRTRSARRFVWEFEES